MNPRRLIPYVVVFLVVVATYVGLRWHQGKKETQEQQAKQVFNLQEAEITALSLKRGKEEIQLTRQGAAWEITKPLKAKADPETTGNLVKTLAELKKERNLGPGDLKAYGLEETGVTISFTAKGEQYRVVLGEPVPGGRGHYARKDDDPNVFLVNTGAWNSLNQQMFTLRDKTLWAFTPAQVKAIKIRTDKTKVDLEKTDTGAWRWLGRTAFRLRSDRVEQLLRQLQGARISDFSPALPKDSRAVGLAPQAKAEVTLVTPQGAETLFLGTGTGSEVYARLGAQGQVVKVNKDLPEQVARTASTLEDRRLWTGAETDVGKVVWGPPGKTRTAVREGNAWKITGPDQAEAQQSVMRFQDGIMRFKNLEYTSLLPQAGARGKETYLVEFLGLGDKPLFRLEEVGKKGQTELIVRTKSGETTAAAVIPRKDFDRWQQEMERLSKPPANPMR